MQSRYNRSFSFVYLGKYPTPTRPEIQAGYGESLASLFLEIIRRHNSITFPLKLDSWKILSDSNGLQGKVSP
ncbi:hypothetical protein CH373_09605 [Leptospira perolatii]|uniref:Uncharacterized protein n=1 Tax=Leptospira perolatii TaxID=2023191 RepID=A0A2M9ZMC0_9LEPT|nr:hypothetical protein CH360_07350 [Leptospira perolatii]PJZ73232.1 hypothetical protein CH373_09605 [Leptospira perolatii]